MTKAKMIEMITEAVKNTHNEQDLKDLNEMSKVEIKKILNDIYFGEDFMASDDKGTIKEYKMTKEDELHQDAIDLMDDINKRLGTNHWMSLDEFNREFKHQFTNEEKEKVTALLKRFEEL